MSSRQTNNDGSKITTFYGSQQGKIQKPPVLGQLNPAIAAIP